MTQIGYRSRSIVDDPSDEMFWIHRGWPRRPHQWRDVLEISGFYDDIQPKAIKHTLDEYNERSRRMNPNDPYFWIARGWKAKPANWKYVLDISGYHVDSPVLTKGKRRRRRRRRRNSTAYYPRQDRVDVFEVTDPFNERSRRMNPNDPYFWMTRGWNARPVNLKHNDGSPFLMKRQRKSLRRKPGVSHNSLGLQLQDENTWFFPFSSVPSSGEATVNQEGGPMEGVSVQAPVGPITANPVEIV